MKKKGVILPSCAAEDPARAAQDCAHGQREAKGEEGRDLGLVGLGPGFGIGKNGKKSWDFKETSLRMVISASKKRT